MYAIPTEHQFIDLVVADQQLLDAEFAAIIAASWPDPQPPTGWDSKRPASGRPPARPLRIARPYRTHCGGGIVCFAAHARGGGRAPPASNPATRPDVWWSGWPGSNRHGQLGRLAGHGLRLPTLFRSTICYGRNFPERRLSFGSSHRIDPGRVKV